MSARKLDFLKRLAEDIEEGQLLRPGQAVVVGVSGGPDSMALLRGLHMLSTSGALPLTLHVAHLNHRLRGAASEGDAAFVAEQAREVGLQAVVEAEDIRTQAGGGRGSVEEVARNRRYAFFGRVCVKTGSQTVAIAHHADDNAETILHRIARGTGIRGLGGMAPKRPLEQGSELTLVRPLLGFRRAELASFLAENDIPFRQDESNVAGEYTRARIRQRVLPVLAAEVNPQVAEALLRLSEQARSLDAFLRERASQTLATLIVNRTDREITLNARALGKKSRIVQTEVIRQALLGLRAGEQDVSFTHLSSVAAMAERATGGKEVHLPGGVVARKEYDRLTLLNTAAQSQEVPREPAGDVVVCVPGVTTLAVRRIEISAACEPFDFAAFTQWRKCRSPYEEWLDFDAVHLPLVVRSRREGDRFWPLGAPGTKKLSDFFIERRVRPADRDGVAVLCDHLGPVWVVPYRIDERVKVTRSTRRVLKLSATFLAQES